MIPKYVEAQALLITKDANKIKKMTVEHPDGIPSVMVSYDDLYVYVISINTGWTDYAITTAWHPDRISDIGGNGKFIIGMIQDGKMWVVYRIKGTGVKAQEVYKATSWDDMKDHIRQQWDKGFDITNMNTAEGGWYIVSSYGLNLSQSWITSPDFPDEEISKNAGEGRLVTEIVKVDSTYMYLFSGNTGYTEEMFMLAPSHEKIMEIRDKLITPEKYNGYIISNIVPYKGRLFFIFCK